VAATPHRPPRVAVAADQSLVAEAVRTALQSRGLHTIRIAWSRHRRPPAAGELAAGVADAGLVLCDLANTESLRVARMLVAAHADMPQLVVTPAPPGPLWGSMLDLGVEAVLSNAVTLDQVVDALTQVMAGEVLMTPEEREDLVGQWRAARHDREELLARMQSLSPRERTVLRLLYAGDDVRTIAAMLGVSEATVRSHVKAIRRKLQVSSQLAAVAAFDWLREEFQQRDTWTFPTELRQRGPRARH
jgi:RNA polymerase sigma factor (sigma-70 family)